MTIIKFGQDMERVREIARIRVEMFDRGDGSYSSAESSQALFFEYRNIRRYYGYYSRSGMELFYAYQKVWEE